jgi:hypothetical protein
VADEVKIAARRAPSGKKLVVLHGRGRLGKTAYADYLAQRAQAAGREVILVDADVRNPSLSKLYAPKLDGEGKPIPGTGARVPEGESLEEFGALMTGTLNDLAAARGAVSVVVDIGGGQDRALVEFVRDLNIARFCQRRGITVVPAYAIGPTEDDLHHALAVRDAGAFADERAILLMNEAMVKRGREPLGAFAPVVTAPEYQEWVVNRNACPVWMRNLGCLDLMRGMGLSLIDAMQGKPGEGGKRLGPAEQFMIEDWMEGMEDQQRDAGALELLP